jgi:uncharacterized protein YprB with RNaseH-like and TPR domain
MAGFADKFARLSALKPTRNIAARPATLREPCEEGTLARLLGASVGRNHFGEHLAVRNWYSSPEFSHPAPVTLEILSNTRDEAQSRGTRNALSDPEKWLFLDTETTGLAGGTGTYAFLIGLAWWDAGGLQVEQFFMRDFAEEHSILCELAARVAERPVLITYNGKTFDWPLLQSRFTMTRSIAPPKLTAHLDLLHPARAVWKLRLGSVRLSDLERHVLDPISLGWSRDNDTTSALIPQYYFDYLRGGPPEPLLGIAKHNQMDLRGLAALYCKLNALLNTEFPEHGSVDFCSAVGIASAHKAPARRRSTLVCPSRFGRRRGGNWHCMRNAAASTRAPRHSGMKSWPPIPPKACMRASSWPCTTNGASRMMSGRWNLRNSRWPNYAKPSSFPRVCPPGILPEPSPAPWRCAPGRPGNLVWKKA